MKYNLNDGKEGDSKQVDFVYIVVRKKEMHYFMYAKGYTHIHI